MGMLKGAPVNLDDLIGYSKLQDILNLLLGHVSEQDGTIQQLKLQCAEATAQCAEATAALTASSADQKATAEQIDGQGAVLQQLREDCEALDVREREQDQILEQLRHGDDLSSRVTALEEDSAKLRSASSALEAREVARDGAMEELRRSPGADDQLADLRQQLQELPTLRQDLKDAQDHLARLAAELSGLAQCHETLDSSTKCASPQELQQTLAEMTAGLEALKKRQDDVDTRSAQANSASPWGVSGAPDGASCDRGAWGTCRDGRDTSHGLHGGTGTSQDGHDGRGVSGDSQRRTGDRADFQSVKELEKRIEQIEEADLNMHLRTKLVEEAVDRLSSQLESLSSSGGGSGGSEDRHNGHITSEELSAVSERTKLLGKDLESLRSELAALRSSADKAQDGSQDNVDKIGQLAARLEQLEEVRNGSHKHGDQIEQLATRLTRLEECLETLQATPSDELRTQLQALARKEEKDIRNLSRQLGELRSQLGSLLAKGSSATSKCLTCFDRRYQQSSRVLVGTDGKSYLRRPSLSGPESPDCDVSPERPGSANVASLTDRVSRAPTRGGAGAPVYRHRVVQGMEAPVGNFVKLATSASAGVLHRDRPQTASSAISTTVGPSRNASEPSLASDAACHATHAAHAPPQAAQASEGARAAVPPFQEGTGFDDDHPEHL